MGQSSSSAAEGAEALGHTQGIVPGISLGCHLLEDRYASGAHTPGSGWPGTWKSPKRGVCWLPRLGRWGGGGLQGVGMG